MVQHYSFAGAELPILDIFQDNRYNVKVHQHNYFARCKFDTKKILSMWKATKYLHEDLREKIKKYLSRLLNIWKTQSKNMVQKIQCICWRNTVRMSAMIGNRFQKYVE